MYQAATDRETTVYPVKLSLPGAWGDNQEHKDNFIFTAYFFQDVFGTWQYVREDHEMPPGYTGSQPP